MIMPPETVVDTADVWTNVHPVDAVGDVPPGATETLTCKEFFWVPMTTLVALAFHVTLICEPFDGSGALTATTGDDDAGGS